MYIANHYVKVNGRLYVRGECIEENMPEDKISWLLKAEAIKEVASAFNSSQKQEDPVAEEPQEEAEVPEIDVMAGIVQEEQDKPEKQKRKTQRGGKAK